MAKNIGPSCKKCRLEGEKLFLKGERCFTPKCAIVKRNYPPGLHGLKKSRRPSEFKLQLREKQKAKKIYGLLERQFRNYFLRASKKTGVTGEELTRLLESRLDNVVYRLGIANSRKLARQIVSHGQVLVNDRRVDIPSYQVREGEKISIKPEARKKKYFADLPKRINKDQIPSWLECVPAKYTGKVLKLPATNDVDYSVDMNLIVEFYSR